MGEDILSILFGCLATVLAIVSIVLAYLQFRTYTRQSTHSTTPSALEADHFMASTTLDDLEETSPRWSVFVMLPFTINVNLGVLRL
jgi:hypothetical protein